MERRHRYLSRAAPRLDLALCAAILLQAATALWWAAGQGSTNRWQDTRLAALESRADSEQSQNQQVIDRLARIEERLIAQSSRLDQLKSR